MKRALIIFAKEPFKGKANTHSRRYTSGRQCHALSMAFVRNAVAVAGKVRCEQYYMAYDAAGGIPSLLRRSARGFLFFRQEGARQGERLHRAFLLAHRRGANRIVIVGPDAQALPPAYLQSAFTKLASHEAVVGPCLDGGCYLIGLQYPRKELFQRIAWGTRKVFMQTLKRIAKEKVSAALLPPWYAAYDRHSLRVLRNVSRRSCSHA